MSWMSQLFKTYENNVGNEQQPDEQMAPIAHINVNAQLEVILSEEGEFQSVIKIEKERAVTLIPATEASSTGRSSGIAPHALCDTLSFIAGDFSTYCESEKDKKTAKNKNECYINNLKKWAESEYSHPKVQAIYNYVSKNVLILDLIKAGLVELEENNTFKNNKISNQPYDKTLVRFRILSTKAGGDGTWEDVSLIKAYTAYYLNNEHGKKDICYFSGEERVISEKHPKGIVAASYGAKLLSANDNQGYSFRGRFHNPEQAYALSYEASQKIHSALTWLSKTQGTYAGTKTKRQFICWNPEGKKIPNIFEEFDLLENENNQNVKMDYRKKLIKIFQGYREEFDEADSVSIIGLDAATTGRLSITYYHELMASDFLDRIVHWGETCNWYYLRFNAKQQPYYAVETPIFRKIAKCAFGREQGNFIEIDDRVLKEQTQRLVKCMVEKQPIPFDLIQALTIRASTPMAYSRVNREMVLSTACALIRKYHNEKNKEMKGEQEDMRLDLENRDKSYLYGRLLAVYEKVERITYDRDDKRDPNAIRLQSAYVNHPMQTWKILEGLVNPYLQRLKPGSREYYRTLISKIIESFREEDQQQLNQSLKETYLLGYYLQRIDLNKKKDEGKENE